MLSPACRAAAARRQSHRRKPYNRPSRHANHEVARWPAPPAELGAMRGFADRCVQRSKNTRGEAIRREPSYGRRWGRSRRRTVGTRSGDFTLIDYFAQFDRSSTARMFYTSNIDRSRRLNALEPDGIGGRRRDRCGPFTRHIRAYDPAAIEQKGKIRTSTTVCGFLGTSFGCLYLQHRLLHTAPAPSTSPS